MRKVIHFLSAFFDYFLKKQNNIQWHNIDFIFFYCTTVPGMHLFLSTLLIKIISSVYKSSASVWVLLDCLKFNDMYFLVYYIHHQNPICSTFQCCVVLISNMASSFKKNC